MACFISSKTVPCCQCFSSGGNQTTSPGRSDLIVHCRIGLDSGVGGFGDAGGKDAGQVAMFDPSVDSVLNGSLHVFSKGAENAGKFGSAKPFGQRSQKPAASYGLTIFAVTPRNHFDFDAATIAFHSPHGIEKNNVLTAHENVLECRSGNLLWIGPRRRQP